MSGKGIHIENSETTYGVKPVIEECTRLLNDAFPDTAREEALTLISQILSITRIKMRLEESSLRIPGTLIAEIYDKAILRSKHVPIQYIMGKTFFFDDEYIVGEGVLIPRSDTEFLVEEAISKAMEIIRYLHSNDNNIKKAKAISSIINQNNIIDFNNNNNNINNKSINFLEFCTGSGCISISLAKAIAQKGFNSYGVATDISEKALFYARKNLQQILPDNNIRLVKNDLFSDSQTSILKATAGFDMIISNPPYIKSGILTALQPEVIEYEPIIALDGGTDGLKFYRRILELSIKLLAPGGYVLFEIGFDQSSQIKELFENYGIFDNIYIKNDYSGNSRIAVARKANNLGEIVDGR